MPTLHAALIVAVSQVIPPWGDKVLVEYGALGLLIAVLGGVISACFVAIVWLVKELKASRADLLKVATATNETNKALQESIDRRTAVIADLASQLQSHTQAYAHLGEIIRLQMSATADAVKSVSASHRDLAAAIYSSGLIGPPRKPRA